MVNRLSLRVSVSLLLSTFLLSSLSYAQSSGSAVELTLRDGSALVLQHFEHSAANIDVDGRIDESAWGRIAPINEMRVIDPDTLEDTPYDTQVRVFYTERGIYVSFDLQQPADSIVQRISGRDNRDR